MKTKNSLLCVCLLSVLTVASQNPEWIVFNSMNSGLGDNEVRSLSIDSNGIKWIGTVNDAVYTFDGNTWNHYNSANSFVFDDYILCISTNATNNKWIGTRSGGMSEYDGTQWYFWDETHSDIPDDKVYDIQFEGTVKWVATMHGLARFDGTNWTTWNTSNSAIPAEEIRAIAMDGSGNKWIATWGGGLAKFDGSTWTVFDKSNSPIPDDYCISLFYDGTFFWIGTSGNGLAKFDGTNWEIFTAENSGIPSNFVFNTKKEGSKLWFATGAGLALLDGTTWTIFNPSNSGLPGQYTKDIEIDASGNKWIATDQGLAQFRQGGVLSSGESSVASAFNIRFYPNPCSNEVSIEWNSHGNDLVSIELFNNLGNRVYHVPSFHSSPGLNSLVVQLSGLSSGIYYCCISGSDALLVRKFIKK
ncbi:MAG: T9SS type A sorting domain-containing protein [Bacteroidales bacterium]|nr:T9SS type A sorting domain-containing protein [Bacteroidales bacterium]